MNGAPFAASAADAGAAWLAHPLTLDADRVLLRPLEPADFPELFATAQDPALWLHTSANYADAGEFERSFRHALAGRETGTAYPFAIYEKSSGRIIGSTRFLHVSRADLALEIGVTWLQRQFWGSGINARCKQSMLEHCFELLGARRVQFRVKADNARSRHALERIGARLEGVFRKDAVERDGGSRDTAFYSVIDDDWAAVKAHCRAIASSE